MFSCKRCEKEFSEGATCSICMGRYDFPCAGITESGWKKLGDRKSTWKCSACKSVGVSPRTGLAKTVSTDTEAILIELKRLSTQMETLPMLMDSIKSIHNEIAELKTMRAELSDVKSSIEFVHSSVIDVTNKVSSMEQDIEHLKSTKDDISNLRERCNRLELQARANEQRSRLNNIEIKGVPMSNSENLFTIIAKIGDVVNCHIPKDQINYIARVPMRNDSQSKTIICSVYNSYLKNDFVTAAKKQKLQAGDLGLQGGHRVYVNDHLTLENKLLLNKTKALAKERSFDYTWVKNCKVFTRKNSTSPIHLIKNEQDLKKIF